METKDTKIEDNDLEQTEMTDEQFNAFLEQLAKLVETNATTGKEAAKIIRQAKVQGGKFGSLVVVFGSLVVVGFNLIVMLATFAVSIKSFAAIKEFFAVY